MMTEQYLFETIGAIVDGLREVAEITNVQLPNGDFSVSAVNTLTEKSIVNITNSNDESFVDVKIISATPTEFVISDDISYDNQYTYTFKDQAPFFLHEKKIKANEILTKRVNQETGKWQRYPLVLLLRPYTEDLTDPSIVTVPFSLIIVTETMKDWDADTRYANNIKPILEPIYDGIMNGIVDENSINVFGIDEIKHKRTDDCLVDGNPLPDYLDGIRIDFFDLPIRRSCLADSTKTTAVLNLSVAGEGDVLPKLGSQTYKKGSIVSIGAIPSDTFEKWIDESDDSEILDNPYSFVINENESFLATFIDSLLTLFMQIFDSIPVQRGLSWFFGDHSTKDNDVEIGSVRVGGFNTTTYISTGFELVGRTPIDITVHHIPNETAISTRYLVTSKLNAGSSKGFAIYMTSTNLLTVAISDGVANQNISKTTLQNGRLNTIRAQWNGFIGGLVTITINDIIYTEVATRDWVGDSVFPVTVGYTFSSSNGSIPYVLFDGFFEYILNHGQLDKIRNLLDDTGATDGTINGAILSTFWGSTADNIEPYDSTLGATLYKNDGDNSIMPICVETSQAITGFTRLGYFAAGSGALKGLPNKYYISGVDSIIAEGWYTIEELIAYESANVVINQDANTVSLFKVSI